VVVILAIFAAMVYPLLFGSEDDAKVATARSSVRAIQNKIDEHRQVNGSWPTRFEASWFRGGALPRSPWTIAGGTMVNLDSTEKTPRNGGVR